MIFNKKLIYFLTIFLFFQFIDAKKIVSEEKYYILYIQARNKFERSHIVDLGLVPEEISDDYVRVIASKAALLIAEKELKLFYKIETVSQHVGLNEFPPSDDKYHDYRETVSFLESLVENFPTMAQLHEVGKSLEGRAILALHISADIQAKNSETKPGVVFMGGHHAREHLSVEMPLNLAHFLLNESKVNQELFNLLQQRDIWIIPIVNPDGAEYDISPSYRWWRKNMRNNNDGSFGVDLNRNYGFQWGGRGSSHNTSSDIYRGTSALSEPETQSMKNFIESHTNLKALLSYHTRHQFFL